MNDERNPGSTEREAPPSPPRDRVLSHLRQLLTKGVVAGAVLHVSCCDPVPGPVVCSVDWLRNHLSETVYWHAGWVLREGVPVVRLRVSFWTNDGTVTFGGEPQLVGAALAAREVGPGGDGTYYLVPDEGAVTVTVSLPLKCGGTDKPLVLRLDVTAIPDARVDIPIAIVEPATEQP